MHIARRVYLRALLVTSPYNPFLEANDLERSIYPAFCLKKNLCERTDHARVFTKLQMAPRPEISSLKSGTRDLFAKTSSARLTRTKKAILRFKHRVLL